MPILKAEMPCKVAVRVYFGSSEPEYFLYQDGEFERYHSVYHSGPVPSEYRMTAWEGK